MARGYWLVKSEPFKYSWDEFVKDGETYWDGVRNFQARNHLAAMKKDDLVFFYHSNEGKEIVGIARVTKTAYPDPTSDDERWVVIDLKPERALAEAVSLKDIRADEKLADVALVRQSRLSVMPISARHFRRILKLARTPLP